MKRIAVLVAGAFLLQQFAPTMLWATDLASAISSETTTSYTLSGNENVTVDLPAYGGSKTEFSVDGDTHALNGSNGVNGFLVGQGQTLNLTDIALNGFGADTMSGFAVISDGTLNVSGTVINNALIGFSGLDPDDEEQLKKGTLRIDGTLTNNGYMGQKDILVNQGGTFTTTLNNLINDTLVNNGTLESVAEAGDHDETPTAITGTGDLHVLNALEIKNNVTQGSINVHHGATLTIDYDTSAQAYLNGNGVVAIRGEDGNGEHQAGVLRAEGGFNNAGITGVYEDHGGEGGYSYGNLEIVGDWDGPQSTTPLVFENHSTIDVNALTIAGAANGKPAGQLTTNLDDITLHDDNNPANDFITNNGVLNLTGGTNEREIKGNGGIVNIVSGTVNNGGTSKGKFTNQAELNILEGATFNNANADAMTFGALTNEGDLINKSSITVTNGSNAGTISQGTGTGSLTINGEFTNTNATAGAITQNVITVGDNGSLETNAGAVSTSHLVNTGTVVLTGGTNTNVIKDAMNPEWAANPTAGTTQITGTVINQGNIYQNAVQIASTGKLSTELGEGHLKTNTLTNDGTLTVTGGAITGNLAGSSSEAAGELIIDGTITTTSGTSIDQNALTINDGKTLTTYNTFIDVGTLTIGEDATLDNAKNLVLTDGTNNGTLTNLAGYTSIYGGEFVNNGLLEQHSVTIGNEEGSALTTAANNVHATIVNYATLNFTGGTNGNTVTGNGTTHILAGADVTNNGSIFQNVVIAQADTEHELGAGALTSRVDKLSGDIENNGLLTLTGQTGSRLDNTNAITGEGTLTVQNSIVNKADIEQGKVIVAEENTLVNNSGFTIAAALENSGEIANSGVLTIAGTAQTPSTNTGNIRYEGQVLAGTLNVAGYLENSGNGSISQQTINVLDGGTLVTAADKVITGAIVNDGTVEFNAGNIQRSVRNTNNDTTLGTVKITGTDMSMADNRSLQQNTLIVGEGASFTIEQGTINVADFTNNGTLTADLSKVTVADAFTNNNSLTVTNGNVVNDITGANGSFTVSNGQVQITDGSLSQKSVIIADATEGEHPTVRGELTAKVGQIAATNGIENHGKLTLNGALEDAVNTVAISGSDGTLKITGDVINQADITQQTVTVNEDVNFTHNAGTVTAGLENGGTLTNEGTLKINAESNNEGSILGQGNVIIMANGGIDNNGSFAQKSLTINEDGSFITSLDNLTIADASITNNGEFDLLGGTITNNITGSTGILGIGGDVILSEGKTINQQNLLVANVPAGEDPAIIGTLTANASDITITGTFTNDNEMTFTGGENNNAITGNGHLFIGGDLTGVEVTNVAGKQIANTVEITAENHLLAQAGDLTKTVTNAGTLTLSGTNAVNAAQIAGNGELIIDGTIQNTDGKTLANAITINANKSLEANAADVLHSVTNEGAFKLSGGALAVAVANTAGDTATGTVEITGTDVTIAENGSITQNKLTIANTGSFTADMQDGKLTVTSIENNGAFDVTGDLETAISGTGTLNITDTLENKTNVEQKIITIASNKTFTTNGNNVTASQGIDNSGVLSLTGGTNNSNITGSGQVEIAGDILNTDGKTISNAITIGTDNRLQANASDVQHALTNDGTYTVTGGTIGYAVANEAGDTTSGAVTVAGENVVLTEGVALTQKSLTISSGDFTANMADIEVATLTNDATFNVSGDITTDISGQGNLTIANNLENTANVEQTTVTVDDGVNFTTDAGLVTAAINNEAGQVTFTAGQNANEITGAGTVVVDGEVTTTATIANAITVNTGKSLTATAEKLLGTVTNNGTVALTGGELAQSIAGGTTQIQGNVSLGNNATAFHALTVDNDSELALNQVHATVDNATINGTLNMSIASIADGSTDYEGAKLTATNGVTLGSNSGLKLTFINNDLTMGQTTGELSLIEGDVTGDWARALSNNRYKVTANKGKAVVSYTTSAEEIAQEAGANSNEVAAASAWDQEDASDPNSTAYKLQDLSQNNAAGYVEALEDLTPVQVAMVKANVTNLNQSIYTAANNHMQYGGTGMAAGDMFSYKSVWMQGLYGKAKNNVHGGFDGDTYGGAVGLDLAAGDESTLGIGYAYAYSSLNAEGKKIKADTQNVFLYGNYTGLTDWYFDATLGYNFGKYKETKNVFGVGTGKGDYHVNSFAAQAMAQYQLTEYLAPLAGLRYVYANQGAYDDGFGQHIQSTSDNTLTALLGAKAAHNFQAGKFVFKPEVKVAALFDVMQHGDNVTVSTGSNSYSVKTEQLKKFGVETGVGLGIDLTDHVELSLGYDGQFRSHYYNHTGSAKLKYSF